MLRVRRSVSGQLVKPWMVLYEFDFRRTMGYLCDVTVLKGDARTSRSNGNAIKEATSSTNDNFTIISLLNDHFARTHSQI